nr:phosphatidate cytidylyltransferase [uncultured Brumimicrobium sp.]
MNNIVTRAIWGALFVSIIISSFLVGSNATAIVLGFFMAVGLFEFYRFFSKSTIVTPKSGAGVLGGIILYVSLVLKEMNLIEFDLQLVYIPLIFLPFLTVVFSKAKNPLLDLTITFFPWIYVMIPFYLMFKIFNFEVVDQAQWVFVLGLFIMVWTNDTFAYLTGRSFGKTRLIERISPKKSWEGAIGGFLFTIIAGGIYAYFTTENYLFWMISAAIVSPAGILGDLIESRFKRLVDVKDSGTILPGHGGILDRFDAVIYATPFFYLLLIIFF